jgi:hypothetical protein
LFPPAIPGRTKGDVSIKESYWGLCNKCPLGNLDFLEAMDKLKTALANSCYTETLGDFTRAKRSQKPFFDCGG